MQRVNKDVQVKISNQILKKELRQAYTCMSISELCQTADAHWQSQPEPLINPCPTEPGFIHF